MLTSSFRPTVIVGVGRGGLVPAVHISHLLDVRHMRTLMIESTLDTKPYAERHAEPQIVSGISLEDAKDRDILVVDDAVSTGETAIAALQHVRGLRPRNLRFATLVQDTAVTQEELAEADAVIDWAALRVFGWAVFPWTT